MPRFVATMEDLVKVIGASNETPEEPQRMITIDHDTDLQNDDGSDSEKVLSTRLTSLHILSKYEFVLGMFEDDSYPGQVLKD